MSQNKPPTQRKINKVHNVVWATVKHIAHSLEEEIDDSNNNFFYIEVHQNPSSWKLKSACKLIVA